MRFLFPREPKHGDVRTFSKFLWFPKIIDREFRWLEYASWNEIYVVCNYSGYSGWDKLGWNKTIDKYPL